MKKVDKAVEIYKSDIAGKDILEVACGGADFSISASKYAKSVTCIDLDEGRIKGKTLPENVRFEIMDAAKMTYQGESFDNVFLYNAFFHVQTQWVDIEKECHRVLRPGGKIFIIGTWKLDVNLMVDTFGDIAKWYGELLVARIEKNKEI